MGLDTCTIDLLRICTAVTLGDEPLVGQALREAIRDGVEADKIREMLLQVVLFAGFPRVINAFERLAEWVEEPAKGEATAPPDDYWESAGRERFHTIYGQQARRVLDALGGYHPDLADWILRDAYGKVLSRPALDARTRELAAVAMLAVQNLPRQLVSHALGAVRVGTTPDQVRSAMELARPHCREELYEAARAEVEKAIG